MFPSHSSHPLTPAENLRSTLDTSLTPSSHIQSTSRSCRLRIHPSSDHSHLLPCYHPNRLHLSPDSTDLSLLVSSLSLLSSTITTPISARLSPENLNQITSLLYSKTTGSPALVEQYLNSCMACRPPSSSHTATATVTSLLVA